MIVIDASNKIAGRLASDVAKTLLDGENVVIVNAEKAVVSGKPESVFEFYKKKCDRGDKYKGPFYPKMPDRILRRIVRGMLPYKKAKGADAFKRLKVFIGEPDKFKNLVEADKSKLKLKEGKDLLCKRITLGELSKMLGAKKTW